MTTTTEKIVLRDSGNGRFISKQQAANKPRDTWQKERVPLKNPKRQSQGRPK